MTRLLRCLPSFLQYHPEMRSKISNWLKHLSSLYSKTCNTRKVNEAREILFSRDSRSIKNIPPTNKALVQHILRSVLQASKWYQCLNKQHDSRDPCIWGWKRLNENEMQPFWTTLPKASSVCRELIKCGCKKGCIHQYIEINPGPVKNPCGVCLKPVAKNHRTLTCDSCQLMSHIKCSNVSPLRFNTLCKLLHDKKVFEF